jgi:hypothetical protein
MLSFFALEFFRFLRLLLGSDAGELLFASLIFLVLLVELSLKFLK